MNSRLCPRPDRLGTYGNALNSHRHPNPGRRDHTLSIDEVPHLVLSLALEEHEDEYDQGQGPELTELRVVVARHAVQGEWHLLDEPAGQVNERADQRKLDHDRQERPQLGMLLTERRRDLVEPMRRQKSQNET